MKRPDERKPATPVSMEIAVRPPNDTVVESTTIEGVYRAWERIQSSTSAYTHYGSLSLEKFMDTVRRSDVMVWFPFGLGTLTPGRYAEFREAHLLIWSKEYFRNIGLVQQACFYVMELLNLKRIEVIFPSHITAIHGIMGRERFYFEGTLRKYVKVDEDYYDASIYSLIKE